MDDWLESERDAILAMIGGAEEHAAFVGTRRFIQRMDGRDPNLGFAVVDTPQQVWFGEGNTLPAVICASVNDMVVHGVPSDDVVLAEVRKLRIRAQRSVEARAVSAVQVIGDRDALVRWLSEPAPAKARLAEVGFTHPGQTEFVAQASGIAAADAVMMLAGPQLRTVPLTVHIALADVPARLSAELIVRRARIVAQALRQDFGIARPRLAIAALNPHAGEEGRLGDEEARIIQPAIAQLQAEGLAVTGPHPADALFAPRARAGYDAALCMYHDQALIPLKALDFDQGVNVTLGLPIIRTSPDHGTAFAIAGRNQADPGAMIAAIRMTGECAIRRFGEE